MGSPTCHSLETCCIPLPKRRNADTRRRDWFRVLTPTSWMSNVLDATRSPRCSATPRRGCCAWAAPQSSVSPQGKGPAHRRVFLPEEAALESRELELDPGETPDQPAGVHLEPVLMGPTLFL